MVTPSFQIDSADRASHPSAKSAYYYSIHLYSSIGYCIGYYYTHTYSTYSIGRFYRWVSGSNSQIVDLSRVTILDEYSLVQTYSTRSSRVIRVCVNQRSVEPTPCRLRDSHCQNCVGLY